MNTPTQPEIIGADVSRDSLDIRCLADGFQLRLPNTPEGHSQLEDIARDRQALVCFEAAGGHEWLLRASLDEAGIEIRQLPPARTRHSGEAGEPLRRRTGSTPKRSPGSWRSARMPGGRLRTPGALTTTRKQLVNFRKCLLLQNKANRRNGTAGLVEGLFNKHLELLESRIAEVEGMIRRMLAADAVLAGTAAIPLSIPGIGPVACVMQVGGMPELGQTGSEQAAALAGLAPIARDSGRMRGKRAIGGGRRGLQCVLYKAALAASKHNPDPGIFADRLRSKGKPHKVVTAAVARKLVMIVNALCKSRRHWTAQSVRPPNDIARRARPQGAVRIASREGAEAMPRTIAALDRRASANPFVQPQQPEFGRPRDTVASVSRPCIVLPRLILAKTFPSSDFSPTHDGRSRLEGYHETSARSMRTTCKP